MGPYTFFCGLLLILVQLYTTSAQYPHRLQIPGAVLLQTPPRTRTRIQQIPQEHLPRLRKPIPNALPPPITREQVRPVNEEPEEQEPPQRQSILDEEVNKLTQSSFQSSVNQALSEEEPEPSRPVAFRPERPVPILRDQIREGPISRPIPVVRQEIPHARPIQVARPVVRQEPIARPTPQRQVRPSYDDDEEENIPVRRPAAPVRQQRPQPAPRPAQYSQDQREKKPTVQILSKFRNDNEDGSITWGYENEDGTFKEETLGADCITRGKYGYVDPDGVRREFSYETGSKCDHQEELPEEELLPQIVAKGPRRPQPQPQQIYSGRSY